MNFLKRLLAFVKAKKSTPSTKITEQKEPVSCEDEHFKYADQDATYSNIEKNSQCYLKQTPAKYGEESSPLYSRGFEDITSSADADTTKLARQNFSTVLRAINNVSQVELARKLGIHESNVSRIKTSGQLEKVCFLMAACGIEIPSEERKIYDEKIVESLRVLASTNLNDI